MRRCPAATGSYVRSLSVSARIRGWGFRPVKSGADGAGTGTYASAAIGQYHLYGPVRRRIAAADALYRRYRPAAGGVEATRDFLDIFNHRLIAQYYRIWRKYSYPATFEAGGTDNTSQYLLGLAGLGIPGCADNTATPLSRFLALLPVMLLPGRTAEDRCAGSTHGTGYPCDGVSPRPLPHRAEASAHHEYAAADWPADSPCYGHARDRREWSGAVAVDLR